ncbi:MAG: AAA family ATPase [Planctomycetaceae bacterium]
MMGDESQLRAATSGPEVTQIEGLSETLLVAPGQGESKADSTPAHRIGPRVRGGAVVMLEDLLQQKSLSWRQAAEVVAAIADLLVTIHQRGAAHGELGPDRILLPNLGQPELADLGHSDSHQAGPGAGTQASSIGPCTAPEQIQSGRQSLAPQCDVYALGVLLYHLLCSRYPFRSTNQTELWRQIVEDAPQPPRQLAHGIPPELEQLCLRLLAKEPAARPANGAELARELRRVLVETEAFDQSADSSAGAATARRQVAETSREHDLLMAIRWDLSLMSASSSGEGPQAVAGRLHELLQNRVRQCNGTEISHSSVVTVVQLPPLNERMTGLPALLEQALTILSEVAALRIPVGFTIASAVAQAARRSVPSESGLDECGDESLQRPALRLRGRVSESGLEVTPATMELLQRWLPCRSQGGGAANITISLNDPRDSGEIGVRVRTDTTLAGSWPLVGRASQLAILKARWEQTCEGMGQVVLLIGDEGVGKTRLIQELSTVVGESSQRPHWIRWSCRPVLSGQSLHPATEYFREMCQQSQAIDAVEQLRGYLSQWKLSNPETLTMFSSLLQLPTDGLSEEIQQRRLESERLTATQRRDRTQQGLLDWLKQVAATAPVVFVVEDLQWVDPATLALLHALLDQGLNERVLTILTFRPEFETPWGSRAHQTQVALSRLTKRNAVAVFSNITGVTDLSPNLIEQLMAVTEGVPLFVEAFALANASGYIVGCHISCTPTKS